MEQLLLELEPKQLHQMEIYTLRSISAVLNIDPELVNYLLLKNHCEPCKKIGIFRVFDRKAFELVKKEKP